MNNELLERLAGMQHSIWAHWMKYLFSVSKTLEDGSVVIPADKADRWRRQLLTPYSDLSEKEKESDREQARKVIAVLDSSRQSGAVETWTEYDAAGYPVKKTSNAR